MCPDRDPGLVIRDGVPVSTRFDDLYFSREDGLAETAHVFLDGCGLPQAWQRAGRIFTIGETGFGTGLNFLATWDAWRSSRAQDQVLHYLAVEGYPISRELLAQVLAPFGRVAPLARRFLARFPDPVSGIHRIWFPEDRLCLTLAIGDVGAILPTLSARVDAWFLDGFAPAKNPAMWSAAVFHEIARLSAPSARVASFTAAGAVRRGLAEVGFAIAKRPGFGAKRDCIAGHFAATDRTVAEHPWFAPPTALSPGRVAVIGAGVAGAALVGGLAARGIEALWADQHGRVAAEASGNPLGVMMARPSLGDGGGGQVSAVTFRHARALADQLGVPVGGNGVVELALDDAAFARFRALDAAGTLDGLAISLVEAEGAGRAAGVRLDRPALWHRTGGWIDPRAWVAALAGGRRPDQARPILHVEKDGHIWLLRDTTGAVSGIADAVIVAAGAMTGPLLPDAALPIAAVRGQVSRIAETAASRRLASCLAFGSYLSPTIQGAHVAGATYDHAGFDPTQWPVAVRPEGHDRTISTLPPAVARLFDGAPTTLGGRAALRAITPDRQPIAGPIADAAALAAAYQTLRNDARSLAGGPHETRPGLFVLGGLGSRGLVSAPLMAELVISQMLGEPWPVSRDIADAVHPNRFAIRDLKRRRI